MKKTFLFLSGLLLLASCSSSDDVANEVPALDQVQTIVPLSTEAINGVPVKLSLGSIVNVTPSTKGTGTVGGMKDADDNKWLYENLYVLMTTEGNGLVVEDGVVKEKRLPSMDDPDQTDNDPMMWERKAKGWGYVYVSPDGNQYDGKFISRPTDNSDKSGLVNFKEDFSGQDTKTKYYHPQATCQFYAFHIDDATTGGYNTPVLTFDDENGSITTPFVINGTQDLMTGMATEYMPVYNVDGVPSSGYKYPFFSAAVARHPQFPTQPKITMEHQTVRLTFEIVPGAVVNNNEFYVESIGVYSKTKGTLVAAERDITKRPHLIWDPNETPVLLNLMDAPSDVPAPALDGAIDQRQMQPFTRRPITFDGSTDGHNNVTDLYGALFVDPKDVELETSGKVAYGMKVIVSEVINGHSVPSPNDLIVNLPALPAGKTSYAGMSYKVKFYVYPHEAIRAEVELQGWEEGGVIDNVGVDPGLN